MNMLAKIISRGGRLSSILFRMVSDTTRIRALRLQGVQMGQDCLVSGNVSFGSEPYLIKMGNKVKITNGVSFVTHDGGMYVLRNMNLIPDGDLFGRITIGDNVFIGNKATIMPGVTIGDNVIIGYGAIVTKDIPNNSVAVGVPAKVVSSIQDFYERKKDRALRTKNLPYEEKRKVILHHFK